MNLNHYSELRRQALRVFLAFLSLTAVIALVAVLGANGEFVLRVLLSSLTISAASVCAMCCAAYVEHGGSREVGLASAVLAVVAGLLLVAVIWIEPSSEPVIKLAAMLGCTAGFTAHALLLRIPQLPPGQRWVTNASTVAIAVMTALINFLILFEADGKPMGQLIATFAILSGLGTLAIPILLKLRGPQEEHRAPTHPGGPVGSGPGASPDAAGLSLVQVDGHVFEDATGQRYAVHRLEDS
ncbi:MAG: hypothetical protein P1V81_05675 [Planctomycetota bacterium]|nr:hypothetical protein [Planctomycetota bacterium]